MDIIMSMLSIMGYEHPFFSAGAFQTHPPQKMLKLCLHYRLIYYEKQKD